MEVFLLEKRTLRSSCHKFPAFLTSKILIIWYQQVYGQLCGMSFLCGPFFSGPQEECDVLSLVLAKYKAPHLLDVGSGKNWEVGNGWG